MHILYIIKSVNRNGTNILVVKNICSYAPNLIYTLCIHNIINILVVFLEYFIII